MTQAPQGEFRCPQCGGEDYIECGPSVDNQGRLHPVELVCGSAPEPGCGWRGTWSDVLAARRGEAQTLSPEFAAAAEIEANTPIATVTGSTAMALEIESLKQQLAEAREELTDAKQSLSQLLSVYAPQCTPFGTLDGMCLQIDQKLASAHLRIKGYEDSLGIVERELVALSPLREQLAAVTDRADKLSAEGVCMRKAMTKRFRRPPVEQPLDSIEYDSLVDGLGKLATSGSFFKSRAYLWARTCLDGIERALSNSPATSAEAERVRRLEQTAAALVSLMNHGREGGDDLEPFGPLWYLRQARCLYDGKRTTPENDQMHFDSITKMIIELPKAVKELEAALDAGQKGGA